MFAVPCRILVVCIVLSGCGSPSILSEYAGAPTVTVQRTCGSGGYTIHPKSDRVLVRGYAVTEIIDSCTAEREPVRFQRAAQEYLDKNRPSCRITGAQEISFTHSEFMLACTS